MSDRISIPFEPAAKYITHMLSYESFYTGDIAAKQIPWAQGTFYAIVHESNAAKPLPLDDLGTALSGDPTKLRWQAIPPYDQLPRVMIEELNSPGGLSWIAFDDGTSQPSSPWGWGSETVARPIPIHDSEIPGAELLVVERGATENQMYKVIQYSDKAWGLFAFGGHQELPRNAFNPRTFDWTLVSRVWVSVFDGDGFLCWTVASR